MASNRAVKARVRNDISPRLCCLVGWAKNSLRWAQVSVEWWIASSPDTNRSNTGGIQGKAILNPAGRRLLDADQNRAEQGNYQNEPKA